MARQPAPSNDNGSRTGFGPRTSGAIAGLLAALSVAAGTLGAPIVSAFGFFSTLPIFWVGLVHGPIAGVIAAAVATGALALAASPALALAMAAVGFVPAAYVSYLLNLARPADELGGPSDRMAWFPLADALFRISMFVAMGTVVVALASGYTAEAARAALTEFMDEMSRSAPPELALQLGGEAERELAVQQTVALLPFVQPFVSVLSLVANLYLAMRIAANRMARPVDDMPLALRLPVAGLLVFGIALTLSFILGPDAFIARSFAGALGAAFTVAGFAILHLRLRGSAVRLPVLMAAYLLSPIIFPGLLALGLFSTARAVPVSIRKE